MRASSQFEAETVPEHDLAVMMELRARKLQLVLTQRSLRWLVVLLSVKAMFGIKKVGKLELLLVRALVSPGSILCHSSFGFCFPSLLLSASAREV